MCFILAVLSLFLQATAVTSTSIPYYPSIFSLGELQDGGGELAENDGGGGRDARQWLDNMHAKKYGEGLQPGRNGWAPFGELRVVLIVNKFT